MRVYGVHVFDITVGLNDLASKGENHVPRRKRPAVVPGDVFSQTEGKNRQIFRDLPTLGEVGAHRFKIVVQGDYGQNMTCPRPGYGGNSPHHLPQAEERKRPIKRRAQDQWNLSPERRSKFGRQQGSVYVERVEA